MLEGLPIAKGSQVYSLLPCMANRHGLIAGATGTGKTVTFAGRWPKISAVSACRCSWRMSKAICPAWPGLGRRIRRSANVCTKLGIDGFQFAGYPTVFWDLYGEHGHPVRTTISDMGPLLISRLLNLNDTQSGVLNLVFKIADDNGMLLARSQRSARHAPTCRRQRGAVQNPVRQCLGSQHRRDPTRTVGARRAGR